MGRRRGLPGTDVAILRLKRTRADFSPDAVWGLFQVIDRLSFDGGVLTNASEITFFLDNG